MGTDSDAPVRRKLAGELLGPSRHVTLSLPLDSRVDASARKLHVSRSLLLREAIARGLQPATDFLRREERPEAPAGNEL